MPKKTQKCDDLYLIIIFLDFIIIGLIGGFFMVHSIEDQTPLLLRGSLTYHGNN